MAHLASAETAGPHLTADRWTAYSITVWAICMLGFAFDIYEGTIMHSGSLQREDPTNRRTRQDPALAHPVRIG